MTIDAMKSDFNARLMRINAGTGHTKTTIFVGLDESYRYAPTPRTAQKAAMMSLGNLTCPISMLVALGLGLASGLLALAGRYHLAKDLGADLAPTYDMFLNVVIGFGIGIVLTQLFRLRTSPHVVLQGLGVVAILCTYHNLVHIEPDTFAKFFAPEWVRVVLNHSDARSIRIGEISIPI